MKVFFKTFGCRSNLFDTQVMIANLKEYECVQSEQEADIIVINSCTVTNGADAGVQGYINKFKNGDKKIFFTGCGVQSKGQPNYERNLLQGVFPHSLKEQINTLLSQKERFFYPESAPNHIDSTIVESFVGKQRAFIKIQEGCDFACNYCIIPSVRGKARSFPKHAILEQVRRLVDCGVSEVILSGTNVGSWGKDLQKENLATLLREIFAISGLKRVRIGSLEPSQIDSEFLDIAMHEKLERHLHIALQHTSDTMLAIMNRKNRVQSDLTLFTHLQQKGFFLGTDFIVAHPGESKEVWEEALTNFKVFKLTHLHPFIYSPRVNTPSSMMKNTTKGDEAKERLHLLKNLVAQENLKARQKLAHLQTPLKVLIESSRKDTHFDSHCAKGESFVGLDQYFNKVIISCDTPKASLKVGDWVEVREYEVSKEGTYAKI